MKRIAMTFFLGCCMVGCGLLHGCSNRSLYDGMHMVRQHECDTSDENSKIQQMDCREAASVNYEQYQKEQGK